MIIQVRIAASRARRDDFVRPPAHMNIQARMTFRLMGPHSRLKERHRERKEKERRERAKRPEVEEGKNRSWSTQPVFTVSLIGVGVCRCVRTCIMNSQRCFSK